MIIPQCQRRAHLALIARSIVDAGDTASMAAVVVQNLLDHMRRYAEVAHARCGRPPQIVQSPRLDMIAEPAVEYLLGPVPGREPSCTRSEEVIAASHARRAGNDVQRQRR